MGSVQKPGQIPTPAEGEGASPIKGGSPPSTPEVERTKRVSTLIQRFEKQGSQRSFSAASSSRPSLVVTAEKVQEATEGAFDIVDVSQLPATGFQITYNESELEIARQAILKDKRFRRPRYKDLDINTVKGQRIANVLQVDQEVLHHLFGEVENVGSCLNQLKPLSFVQDTAYGRITNELVQAIERDEVYALDHTQKVWHLENTDEANGEIELNGVHYRRLANTAPSSEAIKDKRYDKKMAAHNANLAIITDANNNALCTRSARTDTPDRMQELVLTSLLGVLDSDTKMGLDENNHFTCIITTGLDLNRLKAIGTTIESWTKKAHKIHERTENERVMLEDIKNAIDTVWKEGKPLKVTVKGTEYFIEKPLFKARILSGAAKLPDEFGSIEETRENNKQATQRELSILIDKLGKETDPYYVNLKEILSILPKTDYNKERTVLSLLKDVKNLPNSPEKTKKLSYTYATIAAYINVSGRDFSFKEYRSSQDQGILSLLDMYLHDVTGIYEMEQCKSGCDRTLLLVSMKNALKAFETIYGYPFDPLEIKGDLSTSGNPYQQQFAVLFRKFAKTFGPTILKCVRGKPKVKWHGEIHWLFCDRRDKDPLPGVIGLKK